MARLGSPTKGRGASRPRGLSAGQLAAVADEELVARINDYTVGTLRRHFPRNPPQGYAQLLAGYLPRGFLIVWVAAEVQYQVDNGGFAQFFWNQSRHLADAAVDAFVTIGARCHAAVTAKAIQVYSENRKEIELLRRGGDWKVYWRSAGDRLFDALDGAFYKCNKLVKTNTLQVQWIRSNTNAFKP